MKLRRIFVERFGLWQEVDIGPLAPGLQVIYGPNEAGKTTLRHFIQSVLFGLLPEARRYLAGPEADPLATADGQARFGGTVECIFRGQVYRISRFWRAVGQPAEESSITTADGRPVNTPAEDLFHLPLPPDVLTKVFFLDLRQLQELALLDRAELAEHLLSTSLRVIGVPFGKLLQHVETCLQPIDGPDGELAGVFRSLVPWRDEGRRLQKEATTAAAIAARLEQLAEEQAALAARREEAQAALAVHRKALELYPLWEQTQRLAAELRTLGEVPPSVPGAARKLTELDARIDRVRLRNQKLEARVASLREKIAAVAPPANWPAFSRKLARIQARRSTVVALEEKLAATERRAQYLSGLWAELIDQLPSAAREAIGSLLALPASARKQLRDKARRVVDIISQLGQLRDSAAQAQARHHELRQALVEKLGPLPPEELPQRVAELARQVEELRGRDFRRQHRRELVELERLLAEEFEHLRSQQPVSPPLQLALRAGMAASLVAVVASIFAPATAAWTWGWPLLGFGGLGLASVILIRYFREVAHERRVAACAEQLSQIRRCLGQPDPNRSPAPAASPPTEQTSAHTEPPPPEQIPTTEGANPAELVAQLEAELRRLQRLLPEQSALTQQAELAHSLIASLAEMEDRLRTATDDWVLLCTQLELPPELPPEAYLAFCRHASRAKKLSRALRQVERRRRLLLTRRRRWHARIVTLYRSLDPTADPPADDRPLAELLDRLAAVAADRLSAVREVRRLRGIGQKLSRRLRRLRTATARLTRLQGRILRKVGFASRQALEEAVAAAKQAEELRRQLAELEETLRRQAHEADAPQVLDLLAQHDQPGLQAACQHWEQTVRDLEGQWEKCTQELAKWRRRQGDLSNAQRWWQADARRRLFRRTAGDLCRQALGWLAIRQALLAARQHLEKTYQPQALQIASRLLVRFTAGRYRRLWTPLDRRQLLVDDAEGRTWQVEQLSRGTCDQIYICIRLALGELLGQQAGPLPFLLDDPLVHFDHTRLRHAVDALIDWATPSRQILLFTCHPHLMEAFARRGVPILHLPAPERTATAVDQPTSEVLALRPRRRKPKITRRAPACLPADPAGSEPKPGGEVPHHHADNPSPAVAAVAQTRAAAPNPDPNDLPLPTAVPQGDDSEGNTVGRDSCDSADAGSSPPEDRPVASSSGGSSPEGANGRLAPSQEAPGQVASPDGAPPSARDGKGSAHSREQSAGQEGFVAARWDEPSGVPGAPAFAGGDGAEAGSANRPGLRARVEYYGNHQGSFDAFGRPLHR